VSPAPLAGGDPRAYPARPFLAVSAVIVREGRVLVVRRARPPAQDRYTLPGGVVEAGETLIEAIKREVQEETTLSIEPIEIADYREVIARDDENRPKRHFVIIVFAARWRDGEATPNDEIAETRWVDPDGLDGLPTTDGLAGIVERALERLGA
jgi:8-oxo-dGTP diphosphatase